MIPTIATSFYDNPDQDPLSPKAAEEEKLHRKWDFEVFTFQQHLFPCKSVEEMVCVDESTVGVLRHIDLCAFEACQVSFEP